MTTQQFAISGMSCASCANRIEHTVQQLPEVQSATINFVTETLNVTWKDKPSIDTVTQTIDKMGYHATTFLSTMDDYQTEQKRRDDELFNKKRHVYYMLLFTLPLFIFSMGPMLGLPLPKELMHPVVHILIQLFLTLPVMWFGRKIYYRGFKHLIQRQPNMDSLVAIGTTAAFLQGIMKTIEILIHSSMQLHTHHIDVYFESVAVILTLVTLGKYLEDVTKGKTSSAIKALMNLTPSQATRITKDGITEKVMIEQIRIGDLILIKPGESLPADGIITQGSPTIDESMLTGESLPINKAPGDDVVGASINKNSSFIYEVTKIGQETMLAQIIRLVQDAQSSKAPIALLADTVAGYFVPVVITLSIVSGLSWFFLFNATLDFSLSIAISVLIIACPCALGLATPTAIMVGTGKAASKGILIKSGIALEAAHNITTVVLDKTGTITQGTPHVVDTFFVYPNRKNELLQLMASVEAHSEHPLAESIVRFAQETQSLTLLPVEQFTSMTGKGAKAQVNGFDVTIGNAKAVVSATQHNEVTTRAEKWANQAKSIVYLAINNKVVGVVAIADPIKKTSVTAVRQLQELGLDIWLLSGDNSQTAHAIAQEVGIHHVLSDVLPKDKAHHIKELQKLGKHVMMVGDGINDAPALAQSDVGVAIGSGTDIAIESADVVLMHDDLINVVRTISLSQATIRNIKQNLFWAFSYNVIGIPIAMGILKLLFDGPLLNPMFAALAMSLSSISVLLNALRLRKK